jgi:hypothetical protein
MIWDLSQISLWPSHWNIAPLTKIRCRRVRFEISQGVKALRRIQLVPKADNRVRRRPTIETLPQDLFLTLEFGVDESAADFKSNAVADGKSLGTP